MSFGSFGTFAGASATTSSVGPGDGRSSCSRLWSRATCAYRQIFAQDRSVSMRPRPASTVAASARNASRDSGLAVWLSSSKTSSSRKWAAGGRAASRCRLQEPTPAPGARTLSRTTRRAWRASSLLPAGPAASDSTEQAARAVARLDARARSSRTSFSSKRSSERWRW